jgi:hypothetical protein
MILKGGIMKISIIDVLIRLLILVVFALHSWWSISSAQFDDLLPFKVVYALSVVLHIIHWVQWRLWDTRQ